MIYQSMKNRSCTVFRVNYQVTQPFIQHTQIRTPQKMTNTLHAISGMQKLPIA